MEGDWSQTQVPRADSLARSLAVLAERRTALAGAVGVRIEHADREPLPSALPPCKQLVPRHPRLVGGCVDDLVRGPGVAIALRLPLMSLRPARIYSGDGKAACCANFHHPVLLVQVDLHARIRVGGVSKPARGVRPSANACGMHSPVMMTIRPFSIGTALAARESLQIDIFDAAGVQAWIGTRT